MNLIQELESYIPFNEQEEMDVKEILRRLKNGEELYSRNNNSAHLTASAWVVDKERTHVLMAYHKIYDSWSWLGGHADGEKDLLKVAINEVCEESGVTKAEPVSEEIFSVEILTVDGHVKKGKYVSSHLHLNITYLLEADRSEELTVKEDENSGVAWYEKEKAAAASSEPWFRDHIYSKLNAKLNSFEK